MITMELTQEEMQAEMQKCIASPYCFATTYIKVKDQQGLEQPFTTSLNEEQFNEQFKQLQSGNFRIRI